MSSHADILNHQFSGLVTNESYSISNALKLLHSLPNTLHLHIDDPTFPLLAFLKAKGVSVEVGDSPRHEIMTYIHGPTDVPRQTMYFGQATRGVVPQSPTRWGLGLPSVNSDNSNSEEGGELVSRLQNGVLKFRYKNTAFIVYKSSWPPAGILYSFVFEVPDNVARAFQQDSNYSTIGHELIKDVYRWQYAMINASKGEDDMWVFQNGCWLKDKELWAAIQQSSWEGLVLEQEFLDGLRRDTKTFFENSDIYKDLGVVWKRGLLLLGPPGNGKTETIKVLLRESKQVALYVKSFSTPIGAEAGVKAIFDHARAHAPCILVIEDLDSLVFPTVRSFFLNELDGLAANEGVLTIATTNHPERIDDAILNRPSRFDVKYEFALPTESLRTTYALKWIQKVTTVSERSSNKKVTIRFDSEEELAGEVARVTEGWSFAFLKELFVSFLLRVAHDRSRASVQSEASTNNLEPQDRVLIDQAKKLSSQILTKPKTPTSESPHRPTVPIPIFPQGGLLFG